MDGWMDGIKEGGSRSKERKLVHSSCTSAVNTDTPLVPELPV